MTTDDKQHDDPDDEPKTYAERVWELEQEGMTTSDAQAVADAEDMIRKQNGR